jgi:hypothetical protein
MTTPQAPIPTPPAESKNLSEAVIMQMTADPRLTPGVGFGLRGLSMTPYWAARPPRTS